MEYGHFVFLMLARPHASDAGSGFCCLSSRKYTESVHFSELISRQFQLREGLIPLDLGEYVGGVCNSFFSNV